MEDAHTHVLDLDNKSDDPQTNVESRRSFFAVYDGHGGISYLLNCRSIKIPQ